MSPYDASLNGFLNQVNQIELEKKSETMRKKH